MVSSLPIKRAIGRAPQSHYPSPATLVLKALARDGLPQAHQLRSLVGAKLLDHLSGGLLNLLGHLLRGNLGVDALGYLSHTLTYAFPTLPKEADRYLHLKPGTNRLRAHDLYALFLTICTIFKI